MKLKPRIYIVGASGFLGSGAKEYLEGKGYKVLSQRVDVTDFVALKESFKKNKPDVVINFSGVRAYPNIDWCEDHKEETVKVNVLGAVNVMMAGIESGAYPVQISSGCTYSGTTKHAFTEEDRPNFFGSFYSRMRIVLHDILRELPVLVLRIRMPISIKPHPRNTITKIIAYKKVISVPNSVTLIEDFYPALEKLISTKPVGFLNMTNEGYITHKDVLDAYRKYINPEHKFDLITTKDLRKITKTGRSNCVLSMKKAKSLGISMPKIDKNRLKKIIIEYGKSLNALGIMK